MCIKMHYLGTWAFSLPEILGIQSDWSNPLWTPDWLSGWCTNPRSRHSWSRTRTWEGGRNHRLACEPSKTGGTSNDHLKKDSCKGCSSVDFSSQRFCTSICPIAVSKIHCTYHGAFLKWRKTQMVFKIHYKTPSIKRMSVCWITKHTYMIIQVFSSSLLGKYDRRAEHVISIPVAGSL